MIIITPRPLPYDIKEWRILELKKEIHKLSNRYRHPPEEVELTRLHAEVERRKKG